eukprot:TRINITY_DN487_c0_g2_i1.p1 TRINITY_DN487_c0_g2~~TRINITY_DN487_c0_g2_i1.p1  ORF type:complete len:479 (+),score=87.92 TRINITY_DN487_c0_g2_i1:36-1439(+)
MANGGLESSGAGAVPPAAIHVSIWLRLQFLLPLLPLIYMGRDPETRTIRQNLAHVLLSLLSSHVIQELPPHVDLLGPHGTGSRHPQTPGASSPRSNESRGRMRNILGGRPNQNYGKLSDYGRMQADAEGTAAAAARAAEVMAGESLFDRLLAVLHGLLSPSWPTWLRPRQGPEKAKALREVPALEKEGLERLQTELDRLPVEEPFRSRIQAALPALPSAPSTLSLSAAPPSSFVISSLSPFHPLAPSSLGTASSFAVAASPASAAALSASASNNSSTGIGAGTSSGAKQRLSALAQGGRPGGRGLGQVSTSTPFASPSSPMRSSVISASEGEVGGILMARLGMNVGGGEGLSQSFWGPLLLHPTESGEVELDPWTLLEEGCCGGGGGGAGPLTSSIGGLGSGGHGPSLGTGTSAGQLSDSQKDGQQQQLQLPSSQQAKALPWLKGSVRMLRSELTYARVLNGAGDTT